MTLKIISADQVLYTGNVTSVSLPGALGEFMVLNNHAALLTTLCEGDVKYKEEGGAELSTHVTGGIADVDNNVVSVCVY